MRIIIEGDSREVHEILDRLGESETMKDILDDLAGDVNTLRHDVMEIECRIPDPLKMFEAIYKMEDKDEINKIKQRLKAKLREKKAKAEE